MPQRVHTLLEAWRTAEHERDTKPPDSPSWYAADALVMHAKEAYLAAVREVANRMGSAGMADIPAEPLVGEGAASGKSEGRQDRHTLGLTDDHTQPG